jgi:hypothetical protein
MKYASFLGMLCLALTLNGANVFAQTTGDFTVWKHPVVVNHPAVDYGVVITEYKGNAKAVTIPAVIDGSPVIGLGDFAFAGNTSITSVTIPAGVKGIGDYVFQGCTGLTSVTLPAGITKIENGTFSGCSSLRSISIPNSVTKIEDYAFQGCTALASVTLPNSGIRIDNSAFTACPVLGSTSQTAIRGLGYKGSF